MRHFIFLLLFLFTSTMVYSQIPLVPQPQQLTETEAAPDLHAQSVSIRFMVRDTSGTALIRSQLERELREAGFSTGSAPGGVTITLGIPGQSRSFRTLAAARNLVPDARLGNEGYHLLTESNEIIISAAHGKGLFYGTQTLRQLIRHAAQTGSFPGVAITDWPDMKFRGVMDDISRGPVPTMDFFKQQIERFAEMKINVLTHYVENVVQIKSRPDFAAPGGALSMEEWRELADYALTYHIILIGSFQSFGHFYPILNLPQYEYLGEGNALLTPVLEDSYEFLNDVYREMIPAFHSDIFHINADETFDLGKGRTKVLVDSLGAGRVYANHINRLYDLVTKKYKKRTAIWGDIVLQEEDVFDMLPKDVVIMTWTYSAMDSFEHMITPITSRGFDTWIVPGVLHSFSTMPDFRTSKINIANFIRDGIKHNVEGVLNCAWDDGGASSFSRVWYGMAYGADQSWNSNPDDTTWDDRFSKAIYGDYSGNLTNAIHTLVSLTDITVTERMSEKVMWTKLIPNRLETVRINLTDWDKVLAVSDDVQELLDRAEPQRFATDLAYLQFTNDQHRYMAHVRLNLLAAARAYRDASFVQVNDRDQARTHLVTALRLIADAHQELSRLRDTFSTLWLMENRMYALDRITDNYDHQLRELADVQRRLNQQLQHFDMGLYLMAPNQIRLSIIETDGWYFREWMMSGAIALRDDEPVSKDFLTVMGGEANARPGITQEFDIEGRGIRWHRHESSDFTTVHLHERYDASSRRVIYAHAMIDSPDKRTVRALSGSSDGIQIFVNGKEVNRQLGARSITLDEDEFMIDLEEGRNHLMLKIIQESGDWSFSFRLPDVAVTNSKNRYRISP